MAIQIDLQNTVFGIPLAGAYFRIVHISLARQLEGSIPKHVAAIDVAGYATPYVQHGTRDVDFRRYHVDITTLDAQVGDTFLAKCYAWVMAQPDMDGCAPV